MAKAPVRLQRFSEPFKRKLNLTIRDLNLVGGTIVRGIVSGPIYTGSCAEMSRHAGEKILKLEKAPNVGSQLLTGSFGFISLILLAFFGLPLTLLAQGVTLVETSGSTVVSEAPPQTFSLSGLIKNGQNGFTGLQGPRGIAISGNYLFIVSMPNDSFTVADISDPAHPTHVATVWNGDGEFSRLFRPYNVVVQGKYAYVAAAGGFTIIDISNPNNPNLVAELADNQGGFNYLDWAWDVEIIGDYAYISSRAEGAITVIDVSNPTSPTKITELINGQNNYSGLAQELSYADGILFASETDWGSSVTLIDVSDPRYPVRLSSIQNSQSGFSRLNCPWDIAKRGNFIAIAGCSADAVTIADISNPNTPILIRELVDNQNGYHLDGAQGLAFGGSNLFVASYARQSLSMIDAFDNSSLREVVEVRSGGPGNFELGAAQQVLFYGGYAIVPAEWSNAVDLINLENAADGYSVRLTSQPTAPVTITPHSSNPSRGVTVSPESLTIYPFQWNQSHSFSIHPINDRDPEGPTQTTITHEISSEDTTYNGIVMDSVNLLINDDDPGVIVVGSSSPIELEEGGVGATYRLAVTTQPTDSVTVTISCPPDVSCSRTQLIFTPSDYAVPQEIGVTALLDQESETTHSVHISHSVSSLDGNYDGFSAEDVEFLISDQSISGTVSYSSTALPANGVTINLNSNEVGSLGSTTTAANGKYGLTDIPRGTSYTVTPTKTGYTFIPPTASSTLTSPATHNFTATLNTYTISGTVTDGSNPVPGVSIWAGGIGSTLTASDGTYSFASVPHGTAYTITPSKTGYTFAPTSTSSTLTSAATHHFTAALNTYNIGGTVTDGSNPVPGVSITAVGIGSTLTASDGTYSFASVPYGTAYTLTFSHPDYDLEPPSISGMLTFSLTQNIRATRKAVSSSIWGAITFNGQALSGVEVSDPGLGTKTTDNRGRYEFQNVSPGQTYSLIAKKRGYGFAPMRHSGTKTNSETNLPFTASAGAVVSGVLEQNGKPIADAKVFLVTSQDEEPLEATTGADGAYEFISVPVGTASLHAEKHGITIDKIDELTLEAKSYELENFVDMTTLNKQSYGFWNGFLGMVNILEIINKGSEALSIVVTLATDTGEVPRGVVRYTIPPGQEQDIVLNSISGFSADHYGLVSLESNHEEYDARVTLYAPTSEQGDITFSYSVPVSNKRENRTYMSYNSYNPSRSALDQGSVVANWVSLGNTTSTRATFDLVYYNQTGEEIHRKAVEIPPLGRVDIQAGHEFPGTNNVGLIAVEPRIQGTTYVALLTRYAMRRGTSRDAASAAVDRVDHIVPVAAASTAASRSGAIISASGGAARYALGILAESGTAAPQYAGIGGIGESMSVVELANVSQQTAIGTYKWYSSEGALQAQESFSLAPNAQRHIIIPAGGEGTRDRQSLGSVEIDSESGNLLSATVVYHYDEDDSSISGVEYTPGTEPFGLSLYGSYNLNLGMNNWLRIFNATDNESRVTVHYSQREVAADKTEERSIRPHGRLDLGIHEKATRDTYGVVEVTTSSAGTLAAHVVRTRTSSSRAGFNFTSATGVR